jgi:hypothetical protein
MLHRRLIDQLFTVLTHPVYTVFVALYTHADGFTTLGAHQHNVRDVKRGFELDSTGVYRSALSLYLFLVLGMDIQALDNQSSFIWQDFNHFTALTFFFELPADYFNGITFSDLDFHHTLLNWPKALPGPAKQSS